ncbi:hypothetical protein L1987_72328 [Smallanthus sonchifolius]|uniref:Uncharacterized protein n=1 Tax=Smallanthus sonchifolius TaxID=185202 RepID=A0ACB9AV66_9ASTR|nr:hypothetical protein L1987_72328 [Smallanthus sonchifolius]
MGNLAVVGYDHFRDGTGELFPQEEIQKWEEHVNPRQAIDEIQAEMFHEQGHLCPQCGEINVKVGKNNHIFCWACLGRWLTAAHITLVRRVANNTRMDSVGVLWL